VEWRVNLVNRFDMTDTNLLFPRASPEPDEEHEDTSRIWKTHSVYGETTWHPNDDRRQQYQCIDEFCKEWPHVEKADVIEELNRGFYSWRFIESGSGVWINMAAFYQWNVDQAMGYKLLEYKDGLISNSDFESYKKANK
jgi:predicted lipoprotein with Yx(FWY)xxD motif